MCRALVSGDQRTPPRPGRFGVDGGADGWSVPTLRDLGPPRRRTHPDVIGCRALVSVSQRQPTDHHGKTRIVCHRNLRVGCHAHPPICLAPRQGRGAGGGEHPEVADVDDVVVGLRQTGNELRGQVGVEDDPHAGLAAGTSRSLTTAAAYSRAARTSSRSRSVPRTRARGSVRPCCNGSWTRRTKQARPSPFTSSRSTLPGSCIGASASPRRAGATVESSCELLRSPAADRRKAERSPPPSPSTRPTSGCPRGELRRSSCARDVHAAPTCGRTSHPMND